MIVSHEYKNDEEEEWLEVEEVVVVMVDDQRNMIKTQGAERQEEDKEDKEDKKGIAQTVACEAFVGKF